jgi:hypothetical protein
MHTVVLHTVTLYNPGRQVKAIHYSCLQCSFSFTATSFQQMTFLNLALINIMKKVITFTEFAA